MARNSVSLACLYLVTFISFLGIALPYPVLAPLFLSGTEAITFAGLSPGLLYGIAMAGYPLGQFLGSPLLGVISDHFGRRYTLIVSLAMTCIGYLVSIYALMKFSFLWFAFSRLFTGFWEGILPITRAAAADLQADVSKARSFGYLNASATSGFLFGPIIGGVLANDKFHTGFNPEFIFLFAIIITLIALVVLILFYKDPVKEFCDHHLEATKMQFIDKIKQTWSPMRNAKYFELIMMSTFVTLGFDIYYQFYPLYLVFKWQVLAYDIAIATVILSGGMVFMQTMLMKEINKKLSPSVVIIGSGLCYSVFLSIFIFLNQYNNMLLLFFILGLLIGLLGTSLPVYVSNLTDDSRQGQVMGLMMALRFLGDGIMCLVAGALASVSIHAPFIIASIFVVIGILMFIKFHRAVYSDKVGGYCDAM